MNDVDVRKQKAIKLIQSTADDLIAEVQKSPKFEYDNFEAYFHFHRLKNEQNYSVNYPLFAFKITK